jgi:hypothetical protein
MGSYYVLEVGNFDREQSPATTESGQSGHASDLAGMEPGHQPQGLGSSPVSVPGDGGYYLLNTEDPTLADEDGVAYSFVPQSLLTNYVNAVIVEPGIVSVTPKSEPSQARGPSPRLHPHLIIADDADIGQSCCEGIRSDGRASMYENVGSLGERETLPIPAASVGVVYETAESAKEDKKGM